MRVHVTVLILGVVISCLCGCGDSKPTESNGSYGLYTEVVEKVKNGGIAADDRGVINLPSKYLDLSLHGMAYLTPCPNGIQILFRTSQGRHSDCLGIVYSDETLQEKSRIGLNSYSSSSTTGVGTVQFRVISAMGGKWYSVTTGGKE